jgi:hypothetical protein
MAGSPPVEVEIRGVWYPSMSAAGRALNVTTQAIWKALEDGDIDRVGLGRWKKQDTPRRGRAEGER